MRQSSVTTQDTDTSVSAPDQKIHRAHGCFHVIRRHTGKIAKSHLFPLVCHQHTRDPDLIELFLKELRVTSEEQHPQRFSLPHQRNRLFHFVCILIQIIDTYGVFCLFHRLLDLLHDTGKEHIRITLYQHEDRLCDHLF